MKDENIHRFIGVHAECMCYNETEQKGEEFTHRCHTYDDKCKWTAKTKVMTQYSDSPNEVLNACTDCAKVLMDLGYREALPRYASVYEVTRHCGGPEEGGWYYNWWECVATIPLRLEIADDTEKAIEFLRDRYDDAGDISSVLGGEEFHICIERESGQHATKERPHYE